MVIAQPAACSRKSLVNPDWGWICISIQCSERTDWLEGGTKEGLVLCRASQIHFFFHLHVLFKFWAISAVWKSGFEGAWGSVLARWVDTDHQLHQSTGFLAKTPRSCLHLAQVYLLPEPGFVLPNPHCQPRTFQGASHGSTAKVSRSFFWVVGREGSMWWYSLVHHALLRSLPFSPVLSQYPGKINSSPRARESYYH